jgi:hypothetical protein
MFGRAANLNRMTKAFSRMSAAPVLTAPKLLLEFWILRHGAADPFGHLAQFLEIGVARLKLVT